jgi:hypothetical protein
MKQTTTSLFTNLNKQQLENLTTVVTETLAIGMVDKGRRFSTADLWHIQRQRRGIPARRAMF